MSLAFETGPHGECPDEPGGFFIRSPGVCSSSQWFCTHWEATLSQSQQICDVSVCVLEVRLGGQKVQIRVAEEILIPCLPQNLL
jgi:hypothetical protein